MTITTLIKVTSVGVCHTDLHGMEGHIAFPIPAVFGHEVSGVIEEINCSVEGSRGKYSQQAELGLNKEQTPLVEPLQVEMEILEDTEKGQMEILANGTQNQTFYAKERG